MPLQTTDQIDLSKYPPAIISNDIPRLGDPVAALGNPLGLKNSLTVGVVGGSRSNEEAKRPDSRVRYVQMDLHTNPGSSGGPLFTPKGAVIGMVTQRAEVEGISFAIQLRSVKRMITELEEKRRVSRPWLGFTGITLGPELVFQVTCPRRKHLLRSVGNGVLVTKVHLQSPSSEADLQPGDIITHVNGAPVASLGDILMQSTPENPALELTAVRIISENGELETKEFNSLLHTAEFDIMLLAATS
ncbi:putative serine protease HhoB [Paramicrosporidium saccamoebae]|uniref:Putative serine protease HhoB n=1 Tax=Paramicrosporidium saccamoebae TaxID=1246581 RepID=A0A2H9TG08_9FUNG|nr:putative serine protease HhoB [Paramicrosporidium saccamoebae]